MAKIVHFPTLEFSSQNPPPEHICFDTSFIVIVFFKPHGKLNEKEEAERQECLDFFEKLSHPETIKCITNQVALEMFDQIIEYEVVEFLKLKIPPNLAERIWRPYFKFIKENESFNIQRVIVHINKFFNWLVRNRFLIISNIPKYIAYEDIKEIITDIFKEEANPVDLGGCLKRVEKLFKEKEETINPQQELRIIENYIKDFKLQSDDAKIVYEALNNTFFEIKNLVSLDKDFKLVEGITLYTD